MINQVCGVLEKNRSAEEILYDSLKEDYLIRAKTVSYILEHNPDAVNNIDELNRIAELMSIDEIHIFDDTGTVYSGTIEKYYGFPLIRESKWDISSQCWRTKACQCVRTLPLIPQKEKI